MKDRVEAGRQLLVEHGFSARLTAAGLEGEIAAIEAPPEEIGRLAELSPGIKALGFRYVALDLASTGAAE